MSATSPKGSASRGLIIRLISVFWRPSLVSPDYASSDFAFPNMLVDGNGNLLPLDTLIDRLRQSSVSFSAAWTSNDRGTAMRSSDAGRQCLDFIAARVLEKRRTPWIRISQRSKLKAEFGRPFGLLAKAGVAEFEALIAAGAGCGTLPAGIGQPVACTTAQMIEYITHRHDYYMNFRLEGKRHFLLLCVIDHDGPAAIVEFDLREFCDRCQVIATFLN